MNLTGGRREEESSPCMKTSAFRKGRTMTHNLNQTVQPRINQPAFVHPDALQAMLALGKSAENAGVPVRTLNLVYVRASEINGCSVCLDLHFRDAKKAGETD